MQTIGLSGVLFVACACVACSAADDPPVTTPQATGPVEPAAAIVAPGVRAPEPGVAAGEIKVRPPFGVSGCWREVGVVETNDEKVSALATRNEDECAPRPPQW